MIQVFSHFFQNHWAKATTKNLVNLEELKEPIVSLIDHGYKINLMSKELYKKEKWPNDIEHG